MSPRRLLSFEDAVANVAAAVQSRYRVAHGGAKLERPVIGWNAEGELEAPELEAGCMECFKAVVPHPYVLEWLAQQSADSLELFTVNERMYATVIEGWNVASVLEGFKVHALELTPEGTTRGLQQLIKNRKIDELVIRSQSDLPNAVNIRSLVTPTTVLSKCETLTDRLDDCPLTKAAWQHCRLALKKPLVVEGVVVRGFQRGSRHLGCPTANVGDAATGKNLCVPFDQLREPGTYLGTCCLDGTDYDCIVSAGFATYYDNAEAAIEVHLFHLFDADFYGSRITVTIRDFLRPESDFDVLSDLVFAIQMDCEIARHILRAA